MRSSLYASVLLYTAATHGIQFTLWTSIGVACIGTILMTMDLVELTKNHIERRLR